MERFLSPNDDIWSPPYFLGRDVEVVASAFAKQHLDDGDLLAGTRQTATRFDGRAICDGDTSR